MTSLMAQSGQNFWHSANENLISTNLDERTIIPNSYQTLELDMSGMRDYLREAPDEFSNESRENPLLLELPMPDGSLATFAVSYSPVMQSGLAAKYPQMKSYIGYNIAQNGMRIRFSLTPKGFHGAIHTLDNGPIYIDPYANNQTDYYMSYFVKDHVSNIPAEQLSCSSHDEPNPISNDVGEQITNTFNSAASTRSATENVELRTYLLAIACTGEWGASQGTAENALAQLVLGVNRLNLIFEIDVAFRVILVNDNDLLIFMDPGSDPYPNNQDSGNLIGANTTIINTLIGAGSYDFGHLFNTSCDTGGLASLGAVCSNNKASAITCQYSSNWEYTITRITAHEMGHSFNASHTWNYCGNPDNTNISSGSAYEPGSGNTIMSYNGVCGNDPNNTPAPHDYFHANSLESMHNFSIIGGGSPCAEVTVTNNHYPALSLPYPNGFYIPISTPFQLTADATDEDNDDMTYCWEQYNLSPFTTPMGSPEDTEPSFRSYFPNLSPTRIFPRIENVVNNSSSPWEVLPTYSRNLKFRCSVRDNNPEISGVVWDEMTFEATGLAGPFLVEYPNTNAIAWEVGDYVEVSWDVADTDMAPVNSQTVNIKLSTDGGFTYPITLAESVPNNGARFVMVPDNITTTARIKVEAADNIFFDISNFDFEIAPATEAGYSFDASPYLQQVCLPNAAEVVLPILSLVDYNDPLTFELVNLPTGAVANFSNNPTMPADGDQTLTIDMSGVTGTDNYEVTIIGTAPNADTLVRTFNLEIVSTDFSALQLTGPNNGQQGVSELPTLTWNLSPNAFYYEVQIADNPSFDAASIIDEDLNVYDAEYLLGVLLEKSTPYFWRVRPINACGPGPYTPISAFHTEVLVCVNTASLNIPIPIPGSGTPTVSSIINIPEGGQISDLNISKLKGTHNLVKHIRATLISPEGTELVLFSNLCPGSNTQTFDVALDDEAPVGIPCPPVGASPYLPAGADGLAIFNDEDAEGIWTLDIRVLNDDGDGGFLDEWALEICSNASPTPPTLVNNNQLAVPPGMENTIVNDLLLSEDPNNAPDELEYTIVNPPLYGDLYFQGAPLAQGDFFRQSTINAYNLSYIHNGGPEVTDSFVFTVSDGEGGWISMTTFDIVIDENATVNTTDIEIDNELIVYPNPAQDILFVKLAQPFGGTANVKIYNVQGQVIEIRKNVNGTLSFDTSNLPAGLYIVEMELDGHLLTEKVAVY